MWEHHVKIFASANAFWTDSYLSRNQDKILTNGTLGIKTFLTAKETQSVQQKFFANYTSKRGSISRPVLGLPTAVTLNIVPHFVVTANHTIVLLLLHNCNFAPVMNHSVNSWYVSPRESQPTDWEPDLDYKNLKILNSKKSNKPINNGTNKKNDQ